MGVSKSDTKRIVGLDVVKIIAMLSVVASHSLNVLRAEGIGPGMTQIIHSLTVGGVPLFFMVSGYLLLRRKNIAYKYALRKIFHIIRYMACACILYWVALAIAHRDISLIRNCLSDFAGTFTLNGTFSLFWFLWAMALIYALLPVIHLLYKSYAKVFNAGVCVLGVIVLSSFLISIKLHREIGVAAPPPLKLWNWLFFFMLGAILNRYPMKGVKWGYVIPLFILANVAQRHFIEPILGCYTNLSFAGSPISIALFISIFCWAVNHRWKDTAFIKVSGNYFMPVYTLHPIVIGLLSGVGISLPCPYVLWPAIVAISAIAISRIILRIPHADRAFKL